MKPALQHKQNVELLWALCTHVGSWPWHLPLWQQSGVDEQLLIKTQCSLVTHPTVNRVTTSWVLLSIARCHL